MRQAARLDSEINNQLRVSSVCTMARVRMIETRLHLAAFAVKAARASKLCCRKYSEVRFLDNASMCCWLGGLEGEPAIVVSWATVGSG